MQIPYLHKKVSFCLCFFTILETFFIFINKFDFVSYVSEPGQRGDVFRVVSLGLVIVSNRAIIKKIWLFDMSLLVVSLYLSGVL